MDDKIYQKLNSIEDLNDRLLLKKVLNSVFTSLEQHSQKKYHDLEQRVFSEVENSQRSYNVFSTVQRRRDLDLTNEFLCPILSEDIKERVYDTNSILKSIENEGALFPVFLECDYLIFKDLLEEVRVFKGTIETDTRSYKANFILRKNTVYLEKIIDLYKSFIDNNVSWSTVNSSYISRIADVVLSSCDEVIDSKEVINNLHVDFGEYAKFVKYDRIPLWNIRQVSLKSEGFPMPCEDRINYEHVISLQKDGVEHGYLAQRTPYEVKEVIRTRNSLVISTSDAEAKVWNLWKVIAQRESKMEKYTYEIMCNTRNSSFINNFSTKNGRTIKTKAELIRIINSFKVSSKLEFQYFKLDEKSSEVNVETYDMNYFIRDEIREDNIKKVLALYFKAKDKDYYLSRDILSFLVSEVQLLYPEYKCEGRLI